MDVQSARRWVWARSPSGYRLEVTPAALMTLLMIPDDLQLQLQQMLLDIAEIAERHPQQPQAWPSGTPGQLQLSLNHISIRYSLDEIEKVLAVEHVVMHEERAG